VTKPVKSIAGLQDFNRITGLNTGLAGYRIKAGLQD